MIEREKLVRQFNPVIESVDVNSPLTLGNGDFAFTADVTGLQSLYFYYADTCPLLTMSNWGWHTTPNKEGAEYSLSDLEMTKYTFGKRTVSYPIKETETNSEVYKWLRMNPHRANLGRLRLLLGGCEIVPSEITNIHQELDMYTGTLISCFSLLGKEVRISTCVGEADTVAVKIESKLPVGRLSVALDFPYGSPDISASDFDAKEKHVTRFADKHVLSLIEHKMDDLTYYCLISGNVATAKTDEHTIAILPSDGGNCSFAVSFGLNKDEMHPATYKQIEKEAEFRMYTYWRKGAFIDVTESDDERATELQRRIVTSMYQMSVQDLGSLPPQETGLTCNSWYGKFHLEMHPIHAAFAALYGRGEMLEKSLKWYEAHLDKAIENAKRNGYKGARWPKMIGPNGEDSPSPIAPLLIWQQPHLIYILELLRQSRYRDDRVEVPLETEDEFLERYAPLVEKTAEFMADFVVYNSQEGHYDLLPPLYSVQEKGDPEKIKNPSFELGYWSFGLKTAYDWLLKFGRADGKWLEIAHNMAPAYVSDNKYAAFEGCEDTYTKLCLDHPSQVFRYGWLGDKADKNILLNTLKEIEKTWDYKTLWGWDFALLAMVYAKAGMMEKAFDVLLLETEKNSYVASGNNAQVSRNDLPLYLPGNGSLLLAMTALKSCGGWYVKTEGLMPYPF